MTATLISTAGTVTLRGRSVRFADILAAAQREIEQIPFGSLEFHFAPTRVSVKIIRSQEHKLT